MSEKPKMALAGQDGNIFSILGNASRLLRRAGESEQAKEMSDRVFQSSSYEEALHIISEYVETELSPATDMTKNKQKKEKNAYER